MENINQYADSSSYKLWIQVGLVALAAGWFLGGFGELFWKSGMNTIGNFLRLPGGVLLTAGVAIAGMKADELSNGLRIAAIICAGLLACFTCG